MAPQCILLSCAVAAQAASGANPATTSATTSAATAMPSASAAAADGPADPAAQDPGTAMLLGLTVVVAAVFLTPRVINRYHRRVIQLMNSPAATPTVGRLDALDRADSVQWLIDGMRTRHHLVLGILTLSVAAFSLAAGVAFAYTVPDGSFNTFARLMAMLLFAALAAPVVMLGVSLTRFDQHYWNWFAPPTFFAVTMNIVIAEQSRSNQSQGAEAAAFLHSVAWLMVGWVLLAIVLRTLMLRGHLVWLRARLPTSGWARVRWSLLIWFVGCVASVLILGLETDTPLGDARFNALFAGLSLAPLLILAFRFCIGERSARAVFPLLALGGFSFVSLAALLAPGLDGMIARAYAPVVSEELAQSLLFTAPSVTIALLVAAGVAYLVLSWIGLAYEHKVFSDAQFQVFAWMLTIAGTVAFLERSMTDGDTLFNDASVGVGLAALLALVLYVGLIRLMRAPPARVRLLLLRVFSADQRGEKLLDELAYRWRFVGPIFMIGGPDMARASIDPGEAAKFLRGQFEDDFIRDAEVLESKAVNLDDLPDPDGRFRVNEFFCRADMWKQVVQRLMTLSDTILLDLRGYTPQREGTGFEIALLARLGVLGRTVLVMDASTDRAAVASRMAEGGHPQPLPDAQVITTDDDLDGDALFRALVERAVAARRAQAESAARMIALRA